MTLLVLKRIYCFFWIVLAMANYSAGSRFPRPQNIQKIIGGYTYNFGQLITLGLDVHAPLGAKVIVACTTSDSASEMIPRLILVLRSKNAELKIPMNNEKLLSPVQENVKNCAAVLPCVLWDRLSTQRLSFLPKETELSVEVSTKEEEPINLILEVEGVVFTSAQLRDRQTVKIASRFGVAIIPTAICPVKYCYMNAKKSNSRSATIHSNVYGILEPSSNRTAPSCTHNLRDASFVGLLGIFHQRNPSLKVPDLMIQGTVVHKYRKNLA